LPPPLRVEYFSIMVAAFQEIAVHVIFGKKMPGALRSTP